MRLGRRDVMAGAAGAVALVSRARAQPRPVVKIAVLTDLSGPYRDIAGLGSIACARQAAQEFAASTTLPFDIDVVSADHRNDVARATSLASSTCRTPPWPSPWPESPRRKPRPTSIAGPVRCN